MPIKPENLSRYPANWPQIRADVLERARHRCEFCGVANYALGGRMRSGRFLRALPLGERRLGLEWPEPGSWAWCGSDGVRDYLRIIRIVLTVAHLDHTPENCALENLRALCQRCHLAHDLAHHLQNAYATRRQGRALGELFA
jgi:5-methylcytosine-specific restriction endonuclease McrA